MNKEVILGLLSIILYVISLIFVFVKSSKAQEKRDDKGIMVFSFIVGLAVVFLYYWGMGTFNVINKFDLVLILFVTASSTIMSILSYRGRSLNISGKLIYLTVNFYVLYLAGGYNAVINYFNV